MSAVLRDKELSDETILGMRMHFQYKLVMVQIKLMFVVKLIQLSGDIFVFSLQKNPFFFLYFRFSLIVCAFYTIL